MTRPKREPKGSTSRGQGPFSPRREFPIHCVAGDDRDTAGYRTGYQITSPELASARIVMAAERTSGLDDLIDVPGLMASISGYADAVADGDLRRAEAMLMAQATALQSLFVRLVERGMLQDSLPQYEAHMKLALKAQSQCRTTLQALTELKQGPAIFAHQANVSGGGPLQVNNGTARAHEKDNQPNQLSRGDDELSEDRSAQARAISGHSQMEALVEIHRTTER